MGAAKLRQHSGDDCITCAEPWHVCRLFAKLLSSCTRNIWPFSGLGNLGELEDGCCDAENYSGAVTALSVLLVWLSSLFCWLLFGVRL
jgi:hypothetical protein